MKVKKGIRFKSIKLRRCWAKLTIKIMVRKNFHSLVSTFVYLKIYLEKIYQILLYSSSFKIFNLLV